MKLKLEFVKFNFVVVILSLLFISVVFSNVGYAQEDVIRIDSNLVTVPATVLDRNGRYITNLKKENFQIFEGGVEQEVAIFEPVEQAFTIFFLLDVSGSMSTQMVNLSIAASSFVRQLRPEDKLTAATFADNISYLFKPTKIKELQRGIKLSKHTGEHSTMLYDAVDSALRKINKVRGRKAIVVFSDGAGDGLFATAKDNIKDAEEGEAIIYTVQFDSFSNIDSSNVSKKRLEAFINEANTYMHTLADVTGGRRYQIKEISDLENTFAQIANELGQQYSIGYYPKESGKKGERRQIKVKVNIPNAAVRARESYIVDANK